MIFYKSLVTLISLYIISKKLKVKLVIRNSLIHKYYKFPYSDIDLTLISNDNDEIKKTNLILSKIKKIFPWVGETNSYLHSDISVIKDNMNVYERYRDYTTFKVLQKPNYNEIEYKVFLARMIMADFSKIRFNNIRLKKWSFYLSFTKNSEIFDNKKCVVRALEDFFQVKNLIPNLNSIYPTRLSEHYAKNVFKKLDFNFQILFFFTDFLYAIKFLDFKFTGELLQNMDLQLYEAQLQWELCSLYNQCHLKDSHQIYQHLIHIEEVTRDLNAMSCLNKHSSLIELIYNRLDSLSKS